MYLQRHTSETSLCQTKKKDEQNVHLFSWLGMRDSNPRMPGPEPGALPLGESPTTKMIVAKRL